LAILALHCFKYKYLLLKTEAEEIQKLEEQEKVKKFSSRTLEAPSLKTNQPGNLPLSKIIVLNYLFRLSYLIKNTHLFKYVCIFFTQILSQFLSQVVLDNLLVITIFLASK
jgi:hypothetical protein